MRKIIVKWKLEGTFTLTTSDLDMKDDSSFDDIKSEIEEMGLDAFVNDPFEEGKETLDITEK